MFVAPVIMRKLNRPALVAVLLLSPALACVSKGQYDAAVADAQGAHAKLAASEQARQAEEADLRRQLADAQQTSQDFAQRVSDLSTVNNNLQAKLDESTAISAELRGELERLGKNVDAMLQEKGTLSQALADAKSRLEELRRVQAAAEARMEMFKQFLRKLKSMIDAGQLRVVMRAGRLVIQLPNDVLFDSGQRSLKTAGKQALVELAKVLVTVTGRSFQVTGDTDNVPIHTERFPSNWELSTARAVEVVHFLTSQGVDPHALSAAGYGEFDPVASNDTAEGRAKNRRIEIVLQPNLGEIVAAPEIP